MQKPEGNRQNIGMSAIRILWPIKPENGAVGT